MREALRMLEAEGLVTIYPHRGAVVTRLSIDELKDITEIRVALECMAIRSAIPRYQPSDFEALEALLAKMDEPTHSVQPARAEIEFTKSCTNPAVARCSAATSPR